jgi:hypothetical protein
VDSFLLSVCLQFSAQPVLWLAVSYNGDIAIFYSILAILGQKYDLLFLQVKMKNTSMRKKMLASAVTTTIAKSLQDVCMQMFKEKVLCLVVYKQA